MNTQKTKNMFTGAIIATLAALGTYATAHYMLQPHPRVMGLGCAGASGPLFAMEEDELPICQRIEKAE